MRKINWEDEPSTATPLNADNLNLMQDNIEEAINDIYSTEEIKTNKIWVDGKPIYRIVLEATNIVANDWTTFHHIDNLENVIFINSFQRTGGIITPLFAANASGVQYQSKVQIWENGDVKYYCGLNGTSNRDKVIAIIEYTKNTD